MRLPTIVNGVILGGGRNHHAKNEEAHSAKANPIQRFLAGIHADFAQLCASASSHNL
jgi:hypothetical protein